MKRLTFNGPQKSLLFRKSRRRIARGETGEVSNAEADQAVASGLDVTVEDID